MARNQQLYQRPDLYDIVFPVDAEEVDFFSAALGAAAGVLADLGAGTGALGRAVGARLEASVLLLDLVRSSGPLAIVGDLRALPLATGKLRGAFSRLHSVAYACASGEGDAHAVAREVGRVLAPGARCVIEVPLAHRPVALQGIVEAVELEGVGEYSFHYEELLFKTKFGAALHSRIEVKSSEGVHELVAPIHVFTPEGLAVWLAAGEMELEAFCAAYDLATATSVVPDDSLRAIAIGRKLPWTS